MSRNIVVCCDGTGNIWRASGETNVVRLVKMLAPADEKQIYYYDPGVGTAVSSDDDGLGFRHAVSRLAGLAWGRGVWTNVAAAYAFVMAQYRPGDRIFFFGFSRGAFTVRAVAGLIDLCGLLRPGLENLIPSLFSVYRSADTPDGRHKARLQAGLSYAQSFSQPGVLVHFIGVWDTVESVGLRRMLLSSEITSNKHVKDSYVHVRHAVALDEQRSPYVPRLYLPPKPGRRREGSSFKQLGFSGAHSDVGGGYRDDRGLAGIALDWMVDEAVDQGLIVDTAQRSANQPATDPCGRCHDPIASVPVWALLGMFSRRSMLKEVHLESHESVIQRRRHPEAANNMDGLQGWHWVWLISGLALTVLIFNWVFHMPQGLDLVQSQLWRGVEDVFRLGHVLRGKGLSIETVNTLLQADLLLILCYTLTLPILSYMALRWSAPQRDVPKWLGDSLSTGAILIVADIAENMCTMAAQATAYTPACALMPCVWEEGAFYVLCSIASAIKFGAVATLFVLLAVCLVRGLRRFVRPSGL